MDDLARRAREVFANTRQLILWEMAETIEAQAAEIAKLTAQKEALLRSANTARMAFAGYVPVETAIRQLDTTLGEAP
jgi:hypothetical protein